MSNAATPAYPSPEAPSETQSDASTIYGDVPETIDPAILNASPGIMDLLKRMVQDRMQERMADMQLQTVAQVEAWSRQEAAMAQQIELLQAEILRTAARSVGVSDSLMGDVRVQTTATSTDQPEESNPRPRKCRRATLSQSDLAASVNTQLTRITHSEARRRAALTDTTPQPMPSSAASLAPQVVAAGQPPQVAATSQPPQVAAPSHPPQAATTSQPLPSTLFTFSSAAIADAPVPKSMKKPKKPVVKAKAEIYRYLPREMPQDMGGLQNAMALHLCILWGLLDANQVPQNPLDIVVNKFNMRFFNETQLYSSQSSGRELIPRHLVQVGTAMSAVQHGRIANQARLVEEHMLEYIQACLAKLGLVYWCPDLRMSAYSLYNAAHRIVALDTFRQALISHTYIHLSPNIAYATSTLILIQLFDHFVFHYMKSRYLKEGRHPGTVTRSLQNNPQYVAHIRLAESCMNFLVENNYPQRYRDLIKPKATSDDEYDPRRKVWIIKRRPERSDKANTFVRILDCKRKQAAQQENPRKWRERVRVEADPGEEADSQFQSLPEGMPVDYFNPHFFNQLQPRTRNRAAIQQVAFLPNINRSLTWNAAERANDLAFNKKYGDAVFQQYKMVSDAEMHEYDGSDADDEWMADEDDTEMSQTPTRANTIDADAINISRNVLSAHLSATASDSTFSSSNDNLSQSTVGFSGHFSGSESVLSAGHFSNSALSATNSSQAL